MFKFGLTTPRKGTWECLKCECRSKLLIKWHTQRKTVFSLCQPVYNVYTWAVQPSIILCNQSVQKNCVNKVFSHSSATSKHSESVVVRMGWTGPDGIVLGRVKAATQLTFVISRQGCICSSSCLMLLMLMQGLSTNIPTAWADWQPHTEKDSS